MHRRAEEFPEAALQRDVVELAAVARVLHAEDAVVVRAFVVVGGARVGGPAEDVARQLLHVVRDATFLRVAGELACKLAGRCVPRLAVTRAAGAVRAALGHCVPEVVGTVVQVVAVELVAARGADDLRNRRVDVQPLQLVAARGERLEDPTAIEALRQLAPTILAGDGREVVEHFVHAAVFALEDAAISAVSIGRTHCAVHVAMPSSTSRLRAAGEHVHVEQAGHDLVQRVERRPRRLIGAQAIEQFFREMRSRSRCRLRLALRELGDDGVAARLHRLVVRVCEEQGARRKIVPGEMPAQLVVRRFPAAERLGRARQPGGHTKHVQQPVRVVVHEMPAVDVHRVERCARSQPYLRQLEWPCDGAYAAKSPRENQTRPGRERASS